MNSKNNASLGLQIFKFFSKERLEEIFKPYETVNMYSRALESISMLEFRNLVIEPEIISRYWKKDNII